MPDTATPLRFLGESVDQEAVIAEVVAALRSWFLAVNGSGASDWAEVVWATQENLRVFTRMLASGAPPTDDELAPLTRSARRRVLAGTPLEEILRAYRIGGQTAWRTVRDAAGPDNLAAALAIADATMRYLGLITDAVTKACLEARDTLGSAQERLAQRLFDALDGAAPPSSDLMAFAQKLGISTTGPYLTFAAAKAGAGPAGHAQLAAEARALGGVLARGHGHGISGLCSDPGRLAPLLTADGLVVAVGQATSSGHLAVSCHDLGVVVDAGVRRGHTGLVGLADFAPEVLVRLSSSVSDAVVARVYGPLPAELRVTLRTLVRCDFDRAATAAALHIHRNTLLYRLGRIEQHTGIDLARIEDQVSIYLATLRLDQADPDEPGSDR